jgi:N-methylhydantoinase A
MRYTAQSFTIPVNLTEVVRDGKGMPGITAAFHAEHERLFGYASPDAPVAVNELMVRTFGRRAKPAATVNGIRSESSSRPASRRDLRFHGSWLRDCPVYARNDLDTAWAQQGPAVIEQDLATVLVPPQFRAEIGPLGDIVLTREA